MIRIPQNGKFSQPNKGELFGNLNKTQGIDMKTNPGKLRIASRLVASTKDSDGGISLMGVPVAFGWMNDKYYAACGIGTGIGTAGTGKLFVTGSDSPSVAFANEGSSNTPSDLHAEYTDMVIWGNGNYAAGSLGVSLIVSTFGAGSNSIIKKLYNTTWDTNWYEATVSGTFRSNGGPKNLCVGFNKHLYICDDDRIVYVPVPTYQTAINAVLTTAGAANTQAGTIDFNGAYRPIWIVTSSNRLWIALMSFDNGGGSDGFIAEWDTTGTAPNKIYDIDAPCALSGVVKDDTLHIIDAYGRLKVFNGGAFVEVARLPVANLNIEMPGIYNDLTNARWIHKNGMTLVDGKINIMVNNLVSSGVYVEEMPSGIWEYDNEIGLYHKSSPCSTSNDWGQKQIATAGAIYGSKRTTGTLLAGCAYYPDNATTERKGIFYDDVGTNTNKRALVTLPFINSPNMQDVWQKVGYRFRPLQSGDKIIGKYRTRKHATLPLLIGITWTSTTTCTTSTDVSAYDPDTLGYNPELETVMGEASGTTAHITDITNNAGTYTITLDDTIGQSSGSGKAYITNFKKISTISDTAISEQVLPLGEKDTKIQVKTELRGTGDFELDDITLINQVFKHNA